MGTVWVRRSKNSLFIIVINEDNRDAFLSVRIIILLLHDDLVDDGVEGDENKYDAYLPLITV